MARKEGTLGVASNIEARMNAPLDSRTVVPTKTDLTLAETFPYSYVGLVVAVQDEGKLYQLIDLPPTDPANWADVGGLREVELTQSEYDALSLAEKYNGTTYFVTDGQSKGNISSSGGWKVAASGIYEITGEFKAGQIKSASIQIRESSGQYFNLTDDDPWSVSVTLSERAYGSTSWDDIRKGLKLLPCIGNNSNTITLQIYSESAWATSASQRLFAHWQLFAKYIRPDVGSTDNCTDYQENTTTGEWDTARAIFDGTMGTDTNAIDCIYGLLSGGKFGVSIYDNEGMLMSASGEWDNSRPMVENSNDGATYLPIKWIQSGSDLITNATYVAVHPDEPKVLFFTAGTFDNAYKSVPDDHSSIGGEFLYCNVGRKEVL